MVRHLDSPHMLLWDSQFGFRKGRTCLTNLLIFLKQVNGCVDEGNLC